MNQQSLIELILHEISSVTGRRVETISPQLGFADMGIESLQAVSIVAQIESHLHLNLDATLMFDYSNVEKLAAYLDQTINYQDSVPLPERQQQKNNDEPIAVVGMSCRFPKADDLNQFLEVLKIGKDCIQDMNQTRWRNEQKKSMGWMGALDNIDLFANDIFNIAESEARRMDPQQRLLLEQVWLAIEDAGYNPKQLSGSNTGVFLGLSNVDYASRLPGSEFSDLFTATGNAHSIAANRISYFFDFQGPSLTVDTACSSSLVALDLAVKSLQSGATNAALCAGANLIIYPEVTTAFSEAKMLSPDGRCFSFSDRANGYVRGEGIGVVYLKRLADAEQDGDQVYALVRATSVNQDGRSSSLLAPSGLAQERVIREALNKANLRPQDIQYHEAHGTGTSLGDPIEALALERVHSKRPGDQPLVVGTVKTNIGHLEAAAGIAGLIKTVLSLYHQKLFPLGNFTKLNEKLVNKIPHLMINTELKDWPDPIQQPRRASVSSFGFGGTNAHAIIEEHPTKPIHTNVITSQQSPSECSLLFGFSSNDSQTLLSTGKNWLNYLSGINESALPSISSSSLGAKLSLPQQFFLAVKSKAQMNQSLSKFIDGQKQDDFWTLQNTLKAQPTTAFLFTGQGSQYPCMFGQIYLSDSMFKNLFDQGIVEAQKYFSENLFEIWQRLDNGNTIFETDYGQILLFIGEHALAQTLKIKFALNPQYVAGHSLGELVAACFSGMISFADAIKMVSYRGKLMRQTAPGAMTSVFTSIENLQQVLRSQQIEVDFAAFNGPELQMMSGAISEIDKLETALAQHKIRFKRSNVKQAFHSSLMKPAAQAFSKAISQIDIKKGQIPVVSSVNTEIYSELEQKSYWTEQIEQPTQFYQMIEKLVKIGVNTFIEIGPQPILNSMAIRFLGAENRQFIHFAENNEFSKDAYFKGLSRLLSIGLLKPQKTQHNLSLPTSIFKKKSFWYSQNQGVAMSSQPSQSRQQENRTSEISKELAEIVASLMKTRVENISVKESLVDLGADSLVLLNALQTLKDRYGVEIPMAEVFKDLNTLEKIANYVAQQTVPATLSSQPSSATGVHELSLIALQNAASAKAAMSHSKNSDLMQIIQAQMHLMSQQLLAMQNMAPQIPPSPTYSAPTNHEKRGVLGNFKSHAETQKSKESEGKDLYLKSFIADFNQQTAKTKEHVQKYRKPLADNRVSAGFRPNTKEMVYPIHCVSAKGSRFIDLDGKEYIDFTMGFGVNLFGHSPDFIESKVIEQIRLGMCVGPQSFLAGPVAELFTQLTGLERVTFVNSGTEAVMTALRLARAYSKRSRIVIFDGSYHGHFDGVLARAHEGLKSTPVAAGIPQSLTEDIIILEYNNPKSLEIIRKLGPELAAVLVEPVQSRFPENQPQEFLSKLREITSESGTAFIWDEVITGFRVNVGGSQKHFGIQADLATYGKILGGGLPIGAVAGHHRYLDFIDGGNWQFGDDSYPQNEMTFFAGTFCKHPLAMAAAQATLLKLKNEGVKLIADLNLKTEILKNNLNSFFKKVGLDIQVNNFGSLFRFKAPLNLDPFFAELNSRGFYIWEGRNLFLSTAHSQEEIDLFENAVKAVTQKLIEVRVFTGKTQEQQKKKFDLTPFQIRFANLELQKSAIICVSAKVKGPLNPDCLRQAIGFIVKHYDLFRCRVSLKERAQWFTDTADKIDFSFTSLRAQSRPWKELDKDLKRLSSTIIPIHDTNSLRIHLYDVVEETHVLAVNAHHLLFDGWTMTLFFEDLAQVYNQLLAGKSPDLPARLTFQKYLQIQDPAALALKTKESQQYWLQEFATDMNPLFPPTSDHGERIVFDLELQLYNGLKKWVQGHKMTPFMFLFSIYAWVLMKHKGLSEVIIGIPAAQRELSGADKMYGNCSNLLPIRLEKGPEDLKEFIQKTKGKIVQAYQNMNYPYESLSRQKGQLIQIYFNLEPTSDLPELNDASLIIYPYPIAHSEMPLMLNVTDFEHYYHCEFDFQTAAIIDDDILAIISLLKTEIKILLKEKNII